MFEPELRHGRWQDVSAGIKADALIFDAPYSEQTHKSKAERNDGSDPDGLAPEYAFLTPDQVFEIVTEWHQFTCGWMVSVTDDILAPVWKEAYRSVDRYAFSAVPCVIRGMSCRMRGDGPSSWSVYAMVSRPKTLKFANWGTLPGAYVGVPGPDASGGRGKPQWLLNALVRDYSRPGDLVVDPFCGWGSTLAAARELGRRSIGIDCDAEAIAKARKLLAKPAQASLFS